MSLLAWDLTPLPWKAWSVDRIRGKFVFGSVAVRVHHLQIMCMACAPSGCCLEFERSSKSHARERQTKEANINILKCSSVLTLGKLRTRLEAVLSKLGQLSTFFGVSSSCSPLSRHNSKTWLVFTPSTESHNLHQDYSHFLAGQRMVGPSHLLLATLENKEMEKRRKGTERLWEILRGSCDFGSKVPSSSTRSVALDTLHLFMWSSTQIAWCELSGLLALTMPLSSSRICCTIMLYRVKALSSLQFHHFKGSSYVFLFPTKLCKFFWGAHGSAQLWGHKVNIG